MLRYEIFRKNLNIQKKIISKLYKFHMNGIICADKLKGNLKIMFYIYIYWKLLLNNIK